jgi:hypothetical protein
MRDRSFENHRYRASGLNLVVAAIASWNTVYLAQAVQSLKTYGQSIDDTLMMHLSPCRTVSVGGQLSSGARKAWMAEKVCPSNPRWIIRSP